jgi:hypothetical protein
LQGLVPGPPHSKPGLAFHTRLGLEQTKRLYIASEARKADPGARFFRRRDPDRPGVPQATFKVREADAKGSLL